MIKIDKVDLNIISEEYFQYLYTWLFDKGNFDVLKETVFQPTDDSQSIRGYYFLCYKMKAALKKKKFCFSISF